MNPPPVPQISVVAVRSPRRKRSIVSELFGLVSSLAIVGLICCGVYFGVTSNKPFMKGAEAGPPVVMKPRAHTAKPIIPDGGGKVAETVEQTTHEQPVLEKGTSDFEGSDPTKQQDKEIAGPDALVHESLKAAKQGMFGKANDLADEARQLAYDHPAATGAWYLAAYAEKYPDLADEALEKLNGDDVYLGPKYGRAAFVEREGDIYKFRWRGGKLELTLAELQKMDDVRFEMTRKFLDNADLTANHLILAAVHYLKNIDETGRYNFKQPEKCLEAAVARCEKAAGRGDEAAEHAEHMLGLFAWLESEPKAMPLKRTVRGPSSR